MSIRTECIQQQGTYVHKVGELVEKGIIPKQQHDKTPKLHTYIYSTYREQFVFNIITHVRTYVHCVQCCYAFNPH